jgi:hypothetical protein
MAFSGWGGPSVQLGFTPEKPSMAFSGWWTERPARLTRFKPEKAPKN